MLCIPMAVCQVPTQAAQHDFGHSTTVGFALPVASQTKLEVFDLQGRRVGVLEDRLIEAGFHSVDWDRRDAKGNPVSAGVYLYRMTAGSFRAQKKMVLLAN